MGQPAATTINPLTNRLAPNETLEPMAGTNIYSSEVYKIKKNGATVGVRKIARSEGPHGIFGFTKREKLFYEYIMTQPDHEDYILPYRKGNQNASSVYINFNYVEGSDLINYLNANGTTLSVKEKRDIAYQTAKALRWLVDKERIHGDIKADNLYRRNDRKILLIDFGRVTQLKNVTFDDARNEIYNFTRKLVVDALKLPAPVFDQGPYDNATDMIIAFYDKMIHDFAPQEGGRRRKTRRRQSRRRR